MKIAFKWTLLGILTIVGIFFLSNISKAFINQAPDKLRLLISPSLDWETVTSRLPGSAVLDPKAGIIRVPYGRTYDYTLKAVKVQGVYRVTPVPMTPTISWSHYWFTVKDQAGSYLHGDLGKILNTANFKEIPITEELKRMLERTASYFVPGLLLAIAAGVSFAFIASQWRRFGKLLDWIHALFVGLPDFFLIVIIQLIAIYISKFTDKRLILIVQVGQEVPFLIPFLTIALIPSVMIYGTMRLAIQRELGQDYVVTARAKGLSRREVLLSHVLRNVLEDLLTVLPKATTIAIASMAVAEAICNILGLGGYVVNPTFQNVSSMPLTCVILALIAISFHGLYALLHKRFIVRTREVA